MRPSLRLAIPVERLSARRTRARLTWQAVGLVAVIAGLVMAGMKIGGIL